MNSVGVADETDRARRSHVHYRRRHGPGAADFISYPPFGWNQPQTRRGVTAPE